MDYGNQVKSRAYRISAKGDHMGDMSRREFGWLATELGIIGVSGPLTAGCSPSPQPSAAPLGGPSAQPTRATTPAVPENSKPRPIRLTQADLDRIIGNHANTLLDHLRARAPGLNYGVAVAFAYPKHEFNRFYMYGTVAEKAPPNERTGSRRSPRRSPPRIDAAGLF